MERGYLLSTRTGMFLDKYGTTETVRSKEGNLMVSEGIGYNKGLNWNLKWKQNMRE